MEVNRAQPSPSVRVPCKFYEADTWMAKRKMMVQIMPRVILTLPSTISGKNIKNNILLNKSSWRYDIKPNDSCHKDTKD